ncbi:hypothetical protein [Streptomyces sp. NPDC059278]|uniref:hypothetical protein n=1 Tax=Streptomyces sp. NPDC059278 TaxID=3346801 RepID=UPI003676B5B2
MTQPPGRSPHHSGDGCTGQPRSLNLDEGYEIRSSARRMITTVALAASYPQGTNRPWDAIADEGAYLARHFGPEGEWFLTGLLAEYVHRGATPNLRGPGELPVLSLAVPPCDPQAAALLFALAERHRQPDSTDEQCAHLEAARVPLQTFMLHMHLTNHRAARQQWVSVFQHDNGTPLLAALGFTAQLVVWAARATLPAQKGPTASATAPMN